MFLKYSRYFLIVLFSVEIARSELIFQRNESIRTFTEALFQVIEDPHMIEDGKLFISISHYTTVLNEIIDELLRKVNSSTSFQHQDIEHMKRGGRRIRRSNVILIESCQDFNMFDSLLKTHYFNNEGFYIIAVYGSCDMGDIQQIFEIMWTQRFVNVNIIHRKTSDDDIEMFSYFPYSPLNCGNSEPRMISKFDGAKFSTKPPYFSEKVKNFHQCPMNVAIFHYPPAMIVTSVNGSIHLEGTDAEILKAIAYDLNFKINPVYSEQGWGDVLTNGSVTGALGLVVDGKADFIIGKTGVNKRRNKYMRPSTIYQATKLVMAVPIGKPYSGAEKLLMPFKKFVWLAVFCLLLIGPIVIFILRKKFNVTVQKFILGSRTTTPHFNLINAFLGGSLTSTQMPGRNFARTLLCIFILYGLVIRSAYTGALFRFIRSETTRHDHVNTIQEVVDADMKVYCIAATVVFLENITRIGERLEVVDKETRMEVFEKMSTDPWFKGVVVTTLDNLVYWNMQNYEKFLLYLGQQHLMTLNYVIYLNKNTHLKTTIDMALSEVSATGIYVNAEKKYYDATKLKEAYKAYTGERKPLSLEQLSGCFQVFAVSVVCSICVFLAELSCSWLSLIRQY